MWLSIRRAFPALLLMLLFCTSVRAQNTAPDFPVPVNDIVPDRADVRNTPLQPASLRAANISWQKRVWRVIDVKEKINHPFSYPERPLVSILLDAAAARKIQLYSTLDDTFSTPLTEEERLNIAGRPDTVPVYGIDEEELTYEIVAREFDPGSVVRYRIQEIWYFDKETSRQEVRIIGMAPIVDERDEYGNVLYERPLFWVYYPGAREALGAEVAYTLGNDAANRNWTDIFDSRFFHSYVTKESNVHGRRIEDFLPGGRDRMLRSQAIEAGLLSREQDSWSH